jgi:phosphatidylglycerol---prolipoprotein diacylglyceryl transferase
MSLGELITGLGYATGIVVLVLEARRRQLATEGIAWIALSGLAGGVIGAKLAELVFHGWPFKVSLLTLFDPSTGGKALLGGLLFGWIAVEIAKRRLGIRRSTGDLFVLALPSGEAVGRVGCFFNGCCYGTECSSPLAVYQHGAWRHPSQLYSAVSAALIFVFLLWIRAKVNREGDLFRIYLLCFGFTRFALEYFRQNSTFWLGLTPMQWFCLELVAYCGATLLYRRRVVQTT